MTGDSKAKLKIIDADGHYFEPPDALPALIEPKYREVAPRCVDDGEGTGLWTGRDWVSEGAIGFANPLFQRVGVAAKALVTADWKGKATPQKYSVQSYATMDPAAYDPIARLRIMNEEGFDAAVLYPSQALVWIPDPEYHMAVNRALNDWLADFCSIAPDRYYGAANIVAIHDVKAASEEVRRCVERHGFKAVFLRTCVAKEEHRWWSTQYDEFWATCQELDVAVGLHPFPGDTMYGAARHFDIVTGAVEKTFLRQPFGSPVDAMNALMGIIIGGVVQRFPNLRLAILEAGGGWVVNFLERLDSRFEYMGHTLPKMTMTPSEYFKRNWWISFDPEEAMLKPSAEWLGSDRIIWGSDYPHPDAFYPGFLEMLNRNISDLSVRDQERIRGRNAIDFYRLQTA